MKKFKNIMFGILAFAILIPAALVLTACGEKFPHAEELKFNSDNSCYASSDLQIKNGSSFVFKITNTSEKEFESFYLTTELQEESFTDLKGQSVDEEISDETYWTVELYDKNQNKVNVESFSSEFSLGEGNSIQIKKGETYYIVVNIVKDFDKVCNLVVYPPESN